MPLKVLLLGEYSNVHTTLAEGLRALGHEVTVASDGDGWKDYPRDVDLRRPDGGRLATLNYYIHLWRWFREFRGYDVVQLINPVFLPLKAERIWPFYRYLRKHNRIIVLGAFGMDYYYVKACLDCHTFRYSDFNFGQTVRHYPTADAFRRDWYEGPKGRLCQHIAADCDGIVAGLYEYWASYGKEAELKDKLTFIPFPIKARSVPMSSYPAADRMGEGHPSFLIGIQRGKEEYKGTDVMLRALERVAAEMPDKCHVVKVESVPFAEYRRLLQGCDVLLDQLYSYTPAMNALEAMAQGLVVVSGGEPENYEILGESQLRPIVNVLPDEQDVYRKLRALAEHPEDVERRKRESADYVRRHHDHLKVAKKYVAYWQTLLDKDG